METVKENVLQKLRKLQNLYEGAKAINSEGEANAAAAAIQRLLTQYNLSIDEIEIKDENEILEENCSGYTFKSIGGVWEYNLLRVLCKWNFCKCFQLDGTYQKLVIFGKKENIETVKWLRSMLSERFVSFSNSRWKEYKTTREFQRKPISKDRYQRSYLIGCAEGLGAKLKEESEYEKRNNQDFNNKVTALVLRNDKEIEEYVSNKYKVFSKKSYAKMDSARQFGFKDGKNTSINKEIE